MEYTVIGFYEESGQTVCHHVEAKGAMHAFSVLAQDEPSLTMVAAFPGKLHEGETVFFPGEGLVDASTILDQPDVFSPD